MKPIKAQRIDSGKMSQRGVDDTSEQIEESFDESFSKVFSAYFR